MRNSVVFDLVNNFPSLIFRISIVLYEIIMKRWVDEVKVLFNLVLKKKRITNREDQIIFDL